MSLNLMIRLTRCFFFNDTATTEIYTLSLHDALPIFDHGALYDHAPADQQAGPTRSGGDRKSTRLNSSHRCISYAVFCLTKNKRSVIWVNPPLSTNTPSASTPTSRR